MGCEVHQYKILKLSKSRNDCLQTNFEFCNFDNQKKSYDAF